MEGVKQSAEGNIGLIQIAELKDSFVYQVVNGIHAPKDLDEAILATHKHIDALEWRKGSTDWRIFILGAFTGSATVAIFRWDLYSIGLGLFGGVCLYIGRRHYRYITRISTEITAAKAVLIEFYKQKISLQMGGIL